MAELSESHDAALALMEAFSLGLHSASLAVCRKMVARVLASAPHAAVLPQMICYLRNHGKSLGQGQGSGLRRVAENLAVALYEADPPAGMMLMRMLVCYGSWKSLVAICSCATTSRQTQTLRPRRYRPPKERSKGKGKGKGKGPPQRLRLLTASGPESREKASSLVSHIHALIADQSGRTLNVSPRRGRQSRTVPNLHPMKAEVDAWRCTQTRLHSGSSASKGMPHEGSAGATAASVPN